MFKNRLELVENRLGGVADFSYWQCYEGRAIGSPDGPIAQLDRVTDFYSVGCRFESCWDRQPLSLRRKGLAVSFYRPISVASRDYAPISLPDYSS
jgi:hypothetical protein